MTFNGMGGWEAALNCGPLIAGGVICAVVIVIVLKRLGVIEKL